MDNVTFRFSTCTVVANTNVTSHIIHGSYDCDTCLMIEGKYVVVRRWATGKCYEWITGTLLLCNTSVVAATCFSPLWHVMLTCISYVSKFKLTHHCSLVIHLRGVFLFVSLLLFYL